MGRGDIRRQQLELTDLWAVAILSNNKGTDPMSWLAESVEYGRSHVYVAEVLNPVNAEEANGTTQLEMLDQSERYLKAARAGDTRYGIVS